MKIQEFRGIHADRRGFIVGNGPSLHQLDLSYLQKEITLGVNRIYLHDTFVPMYYGTESFPFSKNNASKIVAYKGPKVKFIARRCKRWYTRLETPLRKIVWVPFEKGAKGKMWKPQFSFDCAKVVYSGYNVVYMMLQLAVYMGLHPIYLLGIDFDYKDGREPAKHFYPNVKQQGETVDRSQKAKTISAYTLAHHLVNKSKKRVFNATPRSKLIVFPFVTYKSLFA